VVPVLIGFSGAVCRWSGRSKTLLKLTIPRIKLLRNRRELQLRQMRRDIAKLLEAGQEATARIRVRGASRACRFGAPGGGATGFWFLANRTLLQVEHIIREENMMAAQEILELFCELIAVRLPIIEAQKSVPLSRFPFHNS